MEPSSARFWGMMSLSFVIATMMTKPVNWWLVKCGIKHGTGTETKASPCNSVSTWSNLFALFLTLLELSGGVALAARYGDLAMPTGDRKKMGQTPKPQYNQFDKALNENGTVTVSGISVQQGESECQRPQ